MRTIKFTALVNSFHSPSGQRIEIDAYPTKTPGLFVHRKIVKDIDGNYMQDKEWTLSNALGYALVDFRCLRDGLSFAEACGRLEIEWDNVSCLKDMDLREAARYNKLLMIWVSKGKAHL